MKNLKKATSLIMAVITAACVSVSVAAQSKEYTKEYSNGYSATATLNCTKSGAVATTSTDGPYTCTASVVIHYHKIGNTNDLTYGSGNSAYRGVTASAGVTDPSAYVCTKATSNHQVGGLGFDHPLEASAN